MSADPGSPPRSAAARLRFDVFGREMVVEGGAGRWQAWWCGGDGKRRPAAVPIPAQLDAGDIAGYLDDVFHESATPRHPAVRRL